MGLHKIKWKKKKKNITKHQQHFYKCNKFKWLGKKKKKRKSNSSNSQAVKKTNCKKICRRRIKYTWNEAARQGRKEGRPWSAATNLLVWGFVAVHVGCRAASTSGGCQVALLRGGRSREEAGRRAEHGWVGCTLQSWQQHTEHFLRHVDRGPHAADCLC